jgi:ankyrin repeat protein
MAFSTVSFAGLFSGKEHLFMAIAACDLEGVKNNLSYVNSEASADIDINDERRYRTSIEKGDYPINSAITCLDEKNGLKILDILLVNGANPNQVPKSEYVNEPPLTAAVAYGEENAVKLLLKYGAKLNNSESHNNLNELDNLFRNRVTTARLNILNILMEAGADVWTKHGWYSGFFRLISQLDEYLSFNHYPKNAEKLEKIPELVPTLNILLSHKKIDQFIQNQNDWYLGSLHSGGLLVVASYFGFEDLVQKLLQAEMSDEYLTRSFTFAIKKGNLPIAKRLLDKGANINGYDNLHLVKGKNSKEVLDFLLNNGTNIDSKDGADNTLLASAARKNDVEIISFLLERGADISIKNKQNKSPLAIAMKEGNLEAYELISSYKNNGQLSVNNVAVQQYNADTAKPIIKILSPAFERGFKRGNKQFSKNLSIKGRISDKSKIIKATINSQAISLDSTGYFETQVTLKKGGNDFVLYAEDKHGNNATTDFNFQVDGFQTTSATSGLNWYNKQYALIIGIDEYQSPAIPQLNNAVNDAKKLSEIFTGQGYQVTTLFNSQASKKSIMTALKKIRKQTKETDSFVFYFAGHGQGLSLEVDEKVGYILPYDSDLDLSSEDIFEYDESAISLSQVKKYAQAMGAKHVALLLDSCFSGLAMKRSLPKNITRNEAYYNDILSRQSINILTAGDDQPVSDGSGHSPFTLALIEGLENKAIDINDRDGLATFNELAAYVKAKVEKSTNRRQRPQFDNLSQQDGDLIFNLN